MKYYFKYKNKYYGVGSKKCVKKLKEKIKNKDINVKKVKLNKSQRNSLINLNKKKSNKKRNIKGGSNPAILKIADEAIVNNLLEKYENLFQKYEKNLIKIFHDENQNIEVLFQKIKKNEFDIEQGQLLMKLYGVYICNLNEVTNTIDIIINDYYKSFQVDNFSTTQQDKFLKIKKNLEPKIQEKLKSSFKTIIDNNIEELLTYLNNNCDIMEKKKNLWIIKMKLNYYYKMKNVTIMKNTIYLDYLIFFRKSL